MLFSRIIKPKIDSYIEPIKQFLKEHLKTSFNTTFEEAIEIIITFFNIAINGILQILVRKLATEIFNYFMKHDLFATIVTILNTTPV